LIVVACITSVTKKNYNLLHYFAFYMLNFPNYNRNILHYITDMLAIERMSNNWFCCEMLYLWKGSIL